MTDPKESKKNKDSLSEALKATKKVEKTPAAVPKAPPMPKVAHKTDTPDKLKSEPTNPDDPFLSGSSSISSFPVIPIREGVLFPHTEAVLTFGRKISLEGIKASAKTRKLVVLLTQKSQSVDAPKPSDLYSVGTLAVIERTLKTDDTVNALVRGISRVRVLNFDKFTPNISAQVIKIPDIAVQDDELKALASHLQKEFRKTVQMGKPVEFLNFMKLLSGVSESELADQVASTLNIGTANKQQILETVDVKKRLKMVVSHLSHEIKVLEIEKDVVHKTQEQFDKHMKENVLRERLRTIQKELGELDDEEDVNNDYGEKLKTAGFGTDIQKKVKKEIKRLRQMSVNNPEGGYIRSWLDIVFELPWKHKKSKTVDLTKAAKVLDKGHYGLEEVKDRVLEYMAVLRLKQKVSKDKSVKAPTILCFVGPPGVGKTSIGKSIAESLDKKFVKISLGGVRDEAEIRGHRRTYVGAMPGKIIKGVLQAESMNAVFMLDEVDKIGNDFRGDPASALLEVLDPEQNDKFEDHYLDVPYDLSNVMFITTANTLDTIPPALRDRLEIITYSGYTPEEKFNIAKKHLLKKVMKNNGLTATEIKIPDAVLKTTISRYTREAGVRGLERTLGKIMRKVARQIVEDKNITSVSVTQKSLKEYLGPPPFDPSRTEKKNQVGVSTGLAYTSVGGDVLFIEVALTPGKGKVVLTGKLGDVMKESAQIALTYVKANAKKYGIDYEVMAKTDVHIHVPEGAVPKDGPSAGVTLTTAIVSAFTKKPVDKKIAMTGEVTLRGQVLPIGGLKEKSIAAYTAGSKTVLIPKANEKDLEKVPDTVKKHITFIPVATVDEVLKIALK